MNIVNLIPIIALLVLSILILTKYIVIKKPYNYITILFLIPVIIVQTPIVKNMSKELELIFGIVYFVLAIVFMFSYTYAMRNRE